MEDAIRGFCDGINKSDIKCCKSLWQKKTGNSHMYPLEAGMGVHVILKEIYFLSWENYLK